MSELDNNGKKKERFTLFSWMTKDGIGVDPDEPPVMSDPGMKNYFKLLGRKLNQIITVNLLMLACNFTVIFALLAIAGYFSINTVGHFGSSFSQFMGAMAHSENAYTAAVMGTLGAVSEVRMFSTVDYVLFGVAALALFTYGPSLVGSTYILRNMVREEPIFMWSDFKYAIKRNLRQGILFGIIDLVVIGVCIYNIMFYNLNYSQGIFAAMLFFGALLITAFYMIMRTYIYPMMITFDLSIVKLLKNSLLFTILGIKRNALFLLTSGAFLLITFVLMTVVMPIGILIPFVILFSLLAYTGTYWAYPVIHKYMIEPYYNEDGTPKEESEDTSEEELSEEEC